MDAILSFAKRSLFNYILAVATLFTFGLAFWGWWMVYDSDASYGLQSQFAYSAHQAIRAFVFSDVYAEYSEEAFSWQIELAGFLGTLIAISALIKAVLRVFLAPIERFRAQTRRRHIVVLGSRDIALRTAEKLEDGRAVTYHGESREMELSPVLAVARPPSLTSPFMRKSISGADRVLVAESTDGQTAETALTIASYARKSTVFAILDNPWIASNLRQTHIAGKAEAVEEDQLIAVSETRALARTAIMPVPPYLLASRAGQRRIHALFFGFSPLTVAMIEELLFASIMPDQDLPRFTILTNGALKAEAEFNARHPGLSQETSRSELRDMDIEFIECPANGLSDDALKRLAPLRAIDPVTIAYVTREDQDEPLAAALALQLSARQHDLFNAPIFVQSREGNGLNPVRWQDNFHPCGLYAFGGWHDLAMALGILDREPDKLARAYHENYRRVVWNDTDSSRNWDVLPEAFRMANRHAVLHLPAKLAALGFDIRPYLSQDDVLSPNSAPNVAPGVPIIPDDAARELLANLEHERWMMERWVTGWRYSKSRDNLRLRHTDLIPYAQLSEEKKDFDRAFVDWMSEWITRDSNLGVSRPE